LRCVCPRALRLLHADALDRQAHIPVGRLGEPEEIAGIVEMLVKVPYMTNKVDCDLARSFRD
jgi:NAD(P)-dependent dehydrogenase (short-subunit alcohol dehydrogenase family)